MLRAAAILLTALALVPAGAHLAALPNKIALPAEAYLTVQGIYSGWALFGLVVLPATLVNLLLAWRRRHVPGRWQGPLAAGLAMALGLGLFFAFTFPANRATANWTFLPPGWEALRTRWEWSHAANAVLTLIALCCLVLPASRALPHGKKRQRFPDPDHLPHRAGAPDPLATPIAPTRVPRHPPHGTAPQPGPADPAAPPPPAEG